MRLNIRRGRRRPLSPLEQVIMDFAWAHPDFTADSCREGLAPERILKDSTIRTILRNLESKGYLSHTIDGRTYVYRPIDTRRSIAVQEAQRLIERFCGGSVEELLVGLVDDEVLEPKQLQHVADKIAAA